MAIEHPDPPASCAGGEPGSPSLSPLQRLPIELKRQIINYVIPYGLTIMFAQRPTRYFWSQRLRWGIDTCETDKAVESISKQPANVRISRPAQRAYMSLIRTSKDISAEARAMLYSENEFLFRTKMPMIGGRFGPISPRLLRNIKTIRLVVEKNLCHNKGLSGHRDSIRPFIEAINAHSADMSRMSLLKQLWMEVRITAEGVSSRYNFQEGEIERLLYDDLGTDWGMVVRELTYMLEALTTLHPIDRVTVTGLAKWFAACLQLCICGRGGTVLPLHWRNHRIKNARDGTPRYKSVRPDDAPSLDWGEFAERNKVELPGCMLEFFKKHNARFPRPSSK